MRCKMAVELSGRYIPGRVQPDKSIDVIDEAGARVRLKSMTKPPDLADLEEKIEVLSIKKDEAVKNADYETAAELRDKAEKLRAEKENIQKQWRERMNEVDGIVDEEVIAEVVSKMTGVPLTRLEKEESERLLKLEAELHKIGRQSGRSRQIGRPCNPQGAVRPQRPQAAHGFALSSSALQASAKTLLAKAFAEFMFGDPDALVYLDMSEYMEKHNVSRLIGAPPGYVGYEEGGQLTERIRRRPYAVVLLDEVEKAHPDVFNMLLQIMEEGRLTDSFGRHVDFKNVILIMTSNIGADLIKGGQQFGFGKRQEVQDYERIKNALLAECEKFFRPEFINRLDEIIVFRPLIKDDLYNIIEIELAKVRERLKSKNIELELDKAAKDFLIEKGYNPDFGARPLRRAIGQFIEDPLAESLLSGDFKSGQRISVTRKEEAPNLYFNTEDLPAPTSTGDGKSGPDGQAGDGGGGGSGPSGGKKPSPKTPAKTA